MFFLAKNFNAERSSPITIVTRGPAKTIELIVEIKRIEIINDIMFPPVAPNIFVAESEPISITGLPCASAISGIGTEYRKIKLSKT